MATKDNFSLNKVLIGVSAGLIATAGIFYMKRRMRKQNVKLIDEEMPIDGNKV